MPAATVSVAWSNLPPERKVSRLAFAPGGPLAAAAFTDTGSDSSYTFTAPFTGRLVHPATPVVGLAADFAHLSNILAAQWASTVVNTDAPGIIVAGTVVTVRINGNDGFAGDPVYEQVDFEEASALADVAPNDAAASKSGPAPSFDNTAASSNGAPAVSFDNTSAAANSAPAVTFSNTPADQKVITGEQAPVAGVTTPASTAVAHTFPLVAGTHYFVKVGSRAAPVTVTLPDPGSDGQRIEIADLSGQGVAFPITVNAGTRQIDNLGTSYLVNRAYAVLALVYGDGVWKIV